MIVALWILVIILFICITALVAWGVRLEGLNDKMYEEMYRLNRADNESHVSQFHKGQR